MLVDILNKVLVIIFFLCCLNIIRHGYYFIQAWVKSMGEHPEKYRLDSTSLLLLGISLAYLLSTLFGGITIS